MPRTPRCSDIAAYARDSLVLGPRCLRRGLLGARTSPPTLGTPRCSDLAPYAGYSSLLGARSSPATPEAPRSSVFSHRQRCQGLLAPQCSVIASDVGDSSLLVARTSLATPETPCSSVLCPCQRCRGLLGAPLVVGSCYVSSVCYQAAPCCSDQGADLGHHVWGLDTRMSDDAGKLSPVYCCF